MLDDAVEVDDVESGGEPGGEPRVETCETRVQLFIFEPT
jgi:hypothetical protein